ncbi:MAG: molybdopterin molybdotransferase MoeA [Anaerolineae bacterium]|nr:molybdopterin molybdotransferase MoeA [Anaerolineae bacterium]MDW8071582.1 molybdopterin molybdotransferase MoeA [Anaerolineae bacterium]
MPVQPISVDEALEHILRCISPLDGETVPITEALDRVLFEDVVSPLDIPPFVNAAMDGYAVRAADVAGASHATPAVLRVIGEIAAGSVPQGEVRAGTAMRIMTGAPMPPGSDAVVPFEDTDQGRAQVRIYAAVQRGDNVRLAGEDIRQGQVVLHARHTLRPADIGVLAAMGYPTVRVFRRPRVAILATGDELVDVNEPVTPGKIRNSNEYTSIALVRRYGGIPLPLGIARDTPESLTAKIRAGLEQGADLFLTSAGVSVGDFDMVKHVLAAEGEMIFWQVAIKPGKPLAFGHVRGVPLLGLPGNPVAAVVAFEVFARPAILKLGGRTDWRKPSVMAVLDEDVRNSGRRHFMRARVRREPDGYHVTTRGSGVQVQGSGILSSLVWANGLAVVPEDVTFLPAGSTVEVWMLDWPEEVF